MAVIVKGSGGQKKEPEIKNGTLELYKATEDIEANSFVEIKKQIMGKNYIPSQSAVRLYEIAGNYAAAQNGVSFFNANAEWENMPYPSLQYTMQKVCLNKLKGFVIVYGTTYIPALNPVLAIWSEHGSDWQPIILNFSIENGQISNIVCLEKGSSSIYIGYMAGLYGGTAFHDLIYSTDGKTWSRNWRSQNESYMSLASAGNFLYAFGTDIITGNFYRYSTDGVNWASMNIASSIFPVFNKIIERFGRYIAGSTVSGSSFGIAISDDGINFTPASNSPGTVNDLIDSLGVVIAGTNNGLWYSTDNGYTWVQSNFTSGGILKLAEAGEYVIASVGSGGLLYSKDGKVWSQSDITTGNYTTISGFSDMILANNVSVANAVIKSFNESSVSLADTKLDGMAKEDIAQNEEGEVWEWQ